MLAPKLRDTSIVNLRLSISHCFRLSCIPCRLVPAQELANDGDVAPTLAREETYPLHRRRRFFISGRVNLFQLSE
ncbi:hypothetical protein QVD17_02574 [Tagetes erecta]|uniref:Uncharacterized protein n=1 Tax=Tagetes erecta TaxID=13708 RepID=A0AAD8LCQ9_TARER|nr:hypothetical protein QVD17_02574 [Tagetes erecta]